PEFSNSAGVEKVSQLEKGQIRLASEFERIRTRVVAVEQGQEQLRGTSSARELRAEEVYTKSVHAHRVDVETFLSAAGRKVNDALGSVRAHGGRIADLREELGAYVEGSGQALAELDLRLCDHDTHKEELDSAVERMQGEIESVGMRATDAEAALGQFLQDSSQLARVSGIVDTHSRELQVHSERLSAAEMAAQAATSSVEANAVPIDLLAKSIDAINEKFEARTDALREGAETHRQQLEKSISIVADAHKKTKNRVREVAEGVRGVAQIRESIEAVLKEVDNRAKQDASWTYSFKTAAQKLELRLTAMERYLSPVDQGMGGAGGVGAGVGGGVARGEFRGGSELGGAQGQQQGQGYEAFAGTSTHFEEVRSALEQLRAELSGEFRDEQARLSGLLSGMLESQIEEVHARIRQEVQEAQEESEGKQERQLQRTSERAEKGAQRVKELIMDVQEQFLLEHEELDRACKDASMAGEEMGDSLQQLRDTVEGLLDDREAERESLLGRLGALDDQLQRVVGEQALQSAQALQGAGEGRQMREQAERGEEVVGVVRADVEALRARAEELQGALSDQNRSLRELLLRSQEITANRCDSLQEGADELKEDLSQHVACSAQAHVDLQDGVEQRLADVRRSTYAISESQEGLLGRCEEMVGFVSSSARKLVEDVEAGWVEEQGKMAEEVVRLGEEAARAAEKWEKLTEEMGRMQRAAAELEVAVASADAGARSKTASLEKQLKAQAEGLEGLTETANGLQNRITQQAGQVLERVASLQAAVALQTSAEDVKRLKAQLRGEIAAGLEPLSALAQRLHECEGAMQAQGGEVAQLSSGQAQEAVVAQMVEAMRESEVKQSSRLTSVADELLRTVNAYDAELRQVLEQQLVEQAEQRAETEAEAAEMAETFEAVEAGMAELRESLAVQEERIDQLDECSAAHSRSLASSADEAGRAVGGAAAAEMAAGKRHAELEHQIASSAAALKVKLTEAELRTDALEAALPLKLAPLSLFLSAQQSELQQLQAEITSLAEVDERVSAHTDQLSDHVKTLEGAMLQRVALAEEQQQHLERGRAGLQQMQAALQTMGAQFEALRGASVDAEELRTVSEDLEGEIAVERTALAALTASVGEQARRLEALVDRRCAEVRVAVEEETPTLEALETQGRRLQQLEEAQAAAGKTQVAAEEWLASQVGEGRALAEAQHAQALQRVGVLENRLIRQEAAGKSRMVEGEARLQGELGALGVRVEGVGELRARVGVLEEERARLTEVLLRMGEIEEGLMGREERAQSRIEEIEGFIAGQVEAFKGRVPTIPTIHTSAHSPLRRDKGQKGESSHEGGGTEGAANRTPPHRSLKGSQGPGSKGGLHTGPGHTEHTGHTGTGEVSLDVSCISLEAEEEVSEEEEAAPLAGVRASDASLLFSSPGGRYKKGGLMGEGDEGGEGEGGEGAEGGGREDTRYEESFEDEGEVDMDECGDEVEEDEDEDEEDISQANGLTSVQSILDGANFDIAALGMHLEALSPPTLSAPLSAQQQAQRVQAQEELQRKKSAHRRNFQKVLFESLS
ncbi:hypothetical protein B484DRAFT_395978, partial [Ochromonadaceae sp. CCMP2298]